jgi:hypothetical protein
MRDYTGEAYAVNHGLGGSATSRNNRKKVEREKTRESPSPANGHSTQVDTMGGHDDGSLEAERAYECIHP